MRSCGIGSEFSLPFIDVEEEPDLHGEMERTSSEKLCRGSFMAETLVIKTLDLDHSGFVSLGTK